jgi:hypothetical protein
VIVLLSVAKVRRLPSFLISTGATGAVSSPYLLLRRDDLTENSNIGPTRQSRKYPENSVKKRRETEGEVKNVYI